MINLSLYLLTILKWYGRIEGAGGVLKILLVLAGVIFMVVDAAKGLTL